MFNSKLSATLRTIIFRFACCGVLSVVMPLTAVHAEPDGHTDSLQQAIDVYASAQEIESRDERIAAFARSELLFRQTIENIAIDGGIPTSALYSNWGNAALQSQKLGTAILAYRKAIDADPTNERALQNLNYARSLLPEWAARQDQSQLADTLFFWKQSYSSAALRVTAAVLFLFVMLLIAVQVFRSHWSLRTLATILSIGWIAVVLSLLVGNPDQANDAIVIQPESTLYSADTENSAPRINQGLPEGTEVTVSQLRERWVEVEFQGRSGWLRRSAVALYAQY